MSHHLALFWIMLRAALLSTTGTGNLPIVHQDFVGGLRGAALTLIAIALPPLLVLVLVHGLYRRFGHHPATQGFVRGLALAVAGVFVVVLTRIMNTSGWNPTNLMITLGAIVIGATRRVPVFVVLAVAAIVGIALF